MVTGIIFIPSSYLKKCMSIPAMLISCPRIAIRDWSPSRNFSTNHVMVYKQPNGFVPRLFFCREEHGQLRGSTLDVRAWRQHFFVTSSVDVWFRIASLEWALLRAFRFIAPDGCGRVRVQSTSIWIKTLRASSPCAPEYAQGQLKIVSTILRP